MNNIYVDEMPKDCNECPCLNDDIEQGCHCNLGVFDCDDGFKLNKKHPNCPLKPLSDRLAEERKKVVQEIREQVEQNKGTSYNKWVVNYCTMVQILDQSERGGL